MIDCGAQWVIRHFRYRFRDLNLFLTLSLDWSKNGVNPVRTHNIANYQRLRFPDRYPIHFYLAYLVALVRFENEILAPPIIHYDPL